MPTTDSQKLDGYLSVTEVLDFFAEPGLVDWKTKVGKKEAKRISTIALKIGTRVHELIQTGNSFSSKDSIEVHNCLKAWEQFVIDFQPSVEDMEVELKSDILRLVGHKDMTIKLKSQYGLIDLKTSSQIQPKHWMQVARYYAMDKKYEHDFLGVLRLDKNLGIYEFQQKSCTTDMDFIMGADNAYCGLLAAYRFINPQKEVANGYSSGEQDDSADRGF